MSRALITFERRPDASWRPTVAWLATRKRLEARALPGDARRDAWMQAILADASRPRGDDDTTGTWEDWIGWAANAFSNGHDSWAVEVATELTLDALYEREILNVTPRPVTPPNLQPESVVPSDLGGYRRVRPA